MRLIELRHALIASGCNKADQVIALITACNERGTVNGPKIVSAVSDLGYDKRYVATHLSTNAGSSAERHHWYRTAEGHYQMHS